MSTTLKEPRACRKRSMQGPLAELIWRRHSALRKDFLAFRSDRIQGNEFGLCCDQTHAEHSMDGTNLD